MGLAIASLAASAVVLNVWADRFARFSRGGGGQGRLRDDGLLLLESEGEAAILALDPEDAARAAPHAERRATPEAPAGALAAPLEAHLAVTGRCAVRCTGCYLDGAPDAPEADIAALERALEQLAAQGVFEVAFGGGEMLGREAVFGLLSRARALGMVPNLTTSGVGLDEDRARRLAALCGQVNVSIDGLGPVYGAVRGWEGERLGFRALRLLRAAGARVGVNSVLSGALLEGDALEALGRALAAEGVQEWQWLRFKPAGRGAAAFASLAPSPQKLDAIWPRLLAIEAETGLTMRVDCALVPFVVAHNPPRAAVERLALSGCPGGDSLLARGPDGAWLPCSFASGGTTGPDPWMTDPQLRAWRERAAQPPEPCARCDWRAICRGGCRIVAGHLTGDSLAADPECPRVRAA